jgi:signal transduction histidine kinase
LRWLYLFELCNRAFRTPLSTILSSIEILDRYHERLAPQERYSRLQVMRQQVQRMNAMLEDMLTNLQGLDSDLPLRIRAIDLIQTTQAVLLLIDSNPAAQARIRFESSVSELESQIDPQVYDLILSNILTNALKYSQGQVMVQLEQQDGQICLSVQDSGMGIPANQQANLFKPFFRAENIGSIAGLGLGLSLVGEAVQRVGGRIEVDSTEGLGTTVRVYLPIHWQEESSK